MTKILQMKKIYHLSTCSTCQRILKELEEHLSDVTLQDVKQQALTEEEIEFVYSKLGSYEAFFNKRAMKYKSMGLKEKITEDVQYKEYLLMDYTFMKRPLFVLGDKVLAGNAKNVVEEAKSLLS